MIELLLLLETPEDKISFQQMYESIYRRLLFTARGILHKQQDAEDIVHDVFVKFAKKYSSYRGKSDREMLSLGVVMVRNASINLIHERERHKETPMEEEDVFVGDEDPLQDILTAENVSELERAMLKLDEDEKNILTLRFYHDMSYKEIAEVLGIKVKTVDMRLYRTKMKLKEAMKHVQ